MTVTLAFYKGTRAENPSARIGDRLICWRTRSRFSHVELVEHLEPGSHMVSWSSSFRDGGVRRKLIDISTGRWEFVTVPFAREGALHWFREHYGRRYDWTGLLWFLLPLRAVNHDGKWFCSEAVAASLGFVDPYKISPQGLIDCFYEQEAARA